MRIGQIVQRNAQRAIIVRVEPSLVGVVRIDQGRLADHEEQWSRQQVALINRRVRGLSRITQPARRTYGWFTRLHYREGRPSDVALFSDQRHGGIIPALAAAVDHISTVLGANVLEGM